MEQVPAVELGGQPVDLGQRDGRTAHGTAGRRGRRQLGQRHGAVQAHERRRGHDEQLVVQRHHLPPVGGGGRRRVAVHRVHGRLDLVRPRPAPAQASAHEVLALDHERGIPAAAVLVGQEHEVARRRRPRRSAGLDQQHQREQADGLGLVGHQLDQHPTEPHGLDAQVVSDESVARRGRVALVEDEVHDGQHPGETLGQVGVARHAVRDAGVADLGLGPHEPLGHRRLGDEEGGGDLRGREPAEQAERQGDPRLDGEGGVAAREDQAEPLVAHGTLLVGDVGAGGRHPRRLSLPVVARRLAPPPVDGPVAGGGDDPPGGTGGHPRRRPPLDRHGERILDRLLGGTDVTERSDQRGHHPPVLLAEHPLDRRPGHGTAVVASGTGGVGGPPLRRRVRRLGHGSPRRGRPR